MNEHQNHLMICVWDPPDYNIDTKYTLREQVTNTPCPHLINETACEWTLTRYPHWIKLTLESSNEFGNHHQHFEINTFAIIRPPPPKNLNFRDVSPTSVELIWDIGSIPDLYYENPILRFQIIQEDEYGTNSKIEIDNLDKKFKISNLIPATTYRFSIRCRIVQSNLDEFWSEFSNVTITTESDGK